MLRLIDDGVGSAVLAAVETGSTGQAAGASARAAAGTINPESASHNKTRLVRNMVRSSVTTVTW